MRRFNVWVRGTGGHGSGVGALVHIGHVDAETVEDAQQLGRAKAREYESNNHTMAVYTFAYLTEWPEC